MRALACLPALLFGCGHGGGGAPADGAGGDGGGAGDDGGAGAGGGARVPCLPALVPAAPGGDATCGSPRPAAPDLLDDVLGSAGLGRCDLTIPQKRVELLAGSLARNRFRLPWFDAIHEAPLRLPAFTRETIGWLDAAMASQTPVALALQAAAERSGHPAGEVCITEPAVDPGSLAPPTFCQAVAALVTDAGGTPDAAALCADADDVPPALQAPLARIVGAIAAAARARNEALGTLPDEIRDVLFGNLPSLAGLSWSSIPAGLDRDTLDAVAGVSMDYAGLYAAAARLALTIESAQLGGLAGTATGGFDQPTPWGRVVVRGPGDDVYDPPAGGVDDPILLLVDTGGNDTYRIPVAANSTTGNPVSVAIDLGGDDLYGYPEVPAPEDAAKATRMPSDLWARVTSGPSRSEANRQGAARLGVALLFDLGGGHDRYRSLRASQGYGQAGAGVLYDDGGDDTYQAEALAQGAGVYGIGLLIDRAGADAHTLYAYGQGFGFVQSVGVLLDGGGADHYTAEPGNARLGGDNMYPSPQVPNGYINVSMAQGCGFGRRDTGSRGGSGGLGILRDLGAGDDVYLASDFAQGTGYWFGTGILQDAGGDDRYDAYWYAQGGNAHVSLAAFVDEGGNDRYNQELVPMAALDGAGHDMSFALHLDAGGDDRYRTAVRAAGSGFDQGIGLFINDGGNDSYEGIAYEGGFDVCYGSTGGDAFAGARATEPTFGFFVDAGGTDSYTLMSPMGVADGTMWKGTTDSKYAAGAGKGAGGDGPKAGVALP